MHATSATTTLANFLADSPESSFPHLEQLFVSSSTSKATTTISSHLPSTIDGIILCGSSVLDTLVATKKLFEIYSSSSAPPKIFISGGIGHSTHFLYEAVSSSNHETSIILEKDLPEARIFERILTQHFKIPPEFIFVEDKSTNCGQNAEFCVPMILKECCRDEEEKKNTMMMMNFLLLQDPTMQRRSRLSFERHFLNHGIHQSVNIQSICVPFHVFVDDSASSCEKNQNEKIRILPYDLNSRHLPLLLGEIPRLRNDENGYGPKGRNFIGECVIPEKVEKAFIELVKKIEEEKGGEVVNSNSRKL